MNSSTFIAILAAIIIAAGGFWLYTSTTTGPSSEVEDTGAAVNEAQEGDTGDTTSDASEGGGVEVGVDVSAGSSPTSATVNLTSAGFTPRSVTIKKGGTVTWTNQGSSSMWVASAQHPTHTTYSGTSLQQHCDDATDTSFDQCENGTSYSFTFDKVGSWNYHNHSNASQFGTVVVVE